MKLNFIIQGYNLIYFLKRCEETDQYLPLLVYQNSLDTNSTNIQTDEVSHKITSVQAF